MSGDQEEVYGPNFLLKAGRKGDLIIRLNALHKSLHELTQDPNDLPSGLQATAAQLVSVKVLGHSDKDVRLLSACCIVDILRVFAPEAPYCDEEMVRVFEVIISQIRSLSTYDIGSATGSKVVYILDSLAIVKSCVVPVIMAQTGVQGAEDLMTSLFDALISVFRPDHAEDGTRTNLSISLLHCPDKTALKIDHTICVVQSLTLYHLSFELQ
jgi:sister chromatid cohesion protein PDS5